MTLRNTVLVGDALKQLQTLLPGSVDCIITSPPYFGLRDYGVVGQLGQEAHVDEWVANLRGVCRELFRVLADHGSLWLNLGDAYSRHSRFGAPPKSLLMAPERLARALMADGWLLRNKVVWAKTNPLPSPSKDRLTTTHEVVYFFVKRTRYFFDLDAVREPITSRRPPAKGSRTPQSALGALAGSRGGLVAMQRAGLSGHPLGKNPGDVWRIGSASYRGAHFATFPPELIRRPLLATCPPLICTACNQPWRRSSARVVVVDRAPQPRPFVPCSCHASTKPGLVLDPFFGAGTVGLVAQQHGRDWLGIELSRDYVALANDRLGNVRQDRRAA